MPPYVPRDRHLLTTSQAAEYLALSAQCLHAWRSSGIGPIFVRWGDERTSIRYHVDDLESWIEDHRVRPVVLPEAISEVLEELGVDGARTLEDHHQTHQCSERGAGTQ